MDLSTRSLSILTTSSRRLQLPKGIYVFLQSEPADAFYIVRMGSIAIILSSEDGRELIINEMRPGDYFGEVGLITAKSRTTSALTRETSEVVTISGEAFLTVLQAEPRLGQHLLVNLADRLGLASERESSLAFLDAPERLGKSLLSLEKQHGSMGFVTISQEELAQRTGLTRQTVARFLGKWRRNGWLITGRGRIMLLNYEALKEVMGDS
jgi:CRP/FNR family cyclic AMP-dependent transcriptional regulator